MTPRELNWSYMLAEIRCKGYSDEMIAQACGWSQRRVYDVRIAKKYATGECITPPEDKQHKIIALRRFVNNMPHKKIVNNYSKANKNKNKVYMVEVINGFQTG